MKVNTEQSKTRVTSLEASPIMPLAQGCFARVNLLISKFTREILRIGNSDSFDNKLPI